MNFKIYRDQIEYCLRQCCLLKILEIMSKLCVKDAFKNGPVIKLLITYFVLGAMAFLWIEKGDVVIYINRYATDFGDIFFKYFTEAGNGWVIVPVAVITLLYRYYYGVVMTISLLFTFVASYLFKQVFFPGVLRPRAALDESVFTHFIDGFDYHSVNSFPSGHTMAAFSCFFTLALFIPNKYLSYAILIIAFIVGLSRMYLLQHFFVDVYVGSLIGSINTVLALFVTNVIFKESTFSKGLFKMKRDSF